MKKAVLTGLIFCFGLAFCKHKPTELPAPTCAAVSFAKDVNPIITQNCAIAGCHIAGFADGDFTRFSDLKEKVDNGSFKNSVIDWNAPKMPETYKLPEAELKILLCWLNNGAPNN